MIQITLIPPYFIKHQKGRDLYIILFHSQSDDALAGASIFSSIVSGFLTSISIDFLFLAIQIANSFRKHRHTMFIKEVLNGLPGSGAKVIHPLCWIRD